MKRIVLFLITMVVLSYGGLCDGKPAWPATSWVAYTLGSQYTYNNHLWEMRNPTPAYGDYAPGSASSNALGAWFDLGECISFDTTVTKDTNFVATIDTLVVRDTVKAPHTDTIIRTDSTIISYQDSSVTIDSLENLVSFSVTYDTLWSLRDTTLKPSRFDTLPFIVVNKVDTTLTHLIDSVLITKRDSVLSANVTFVGKFDTVVTVVDSVITSDTTVQAIRTLAIDPGFNDTIVVSSLKDTLLPALKDTVVTVTGPDTLFYQPTVTTQDTTYATTLDTNTTEIDSVVQSNKDTIVTTITYHITLNYSITQTDTFWDALLHDTQYDTTLLPADTTARDTLIDMLIYTPTITINVDTLHNADTVQFFRADSVVMGNLDTLVTTAIYGDISDSMIQKTDTLHDGTVVVTIYDTLPILRDTVVLNIQYDTLRHVSAVIPRATTKEPVAIYPNPVRIGSGDVMIGLPADQTYRLRIFDAVGNVVIDRKGQCSEKRLTVSPVNLTSGQYLVILETITNSGRPMVRRGMLGVQR